jgi:hypothetical protein
LIQKASDEDDLSRNSLFLRIDRNYLVPFFTRLRPRTRVDESPNDLDIEEFELVNWRSNERGLILSFEMFFDHV